MLRGDLRVTGEAEYFGETVTIEAVNGVAATIKYRDGRVVTDALVSELRPVRYRNRPPVPKSSVDLSQVNEMMNEPVSPVLANEMAVPEGETVGEAGSDEQPGLLPCRFCGATEGKVSKRPITTPQARGQHEATCALNPNRPKRRRKRENKPPVAETVTQMDLMDTVDPVIVPTVEESPTPRRQLEIEVELAHWQGMYEGAMEALSIIFPGGLGSEGRHGT